MLDGRWGTAGWRLANEAGSGWSGPLRRSILVGGAPIYRVRASFRGFSPKTSHAEASQLRRAHRLLALLAVLPLLAWIISGLLLVIMGPEAVETGTLDLPTEPIRRSVTVRPEAGSTEARVFATPMGNHLLQKTEFGWRHIDPSTGQLKDVPTESQLRSLLEIAFDTDPEGFGEIELVTADSVVTTTGRSVSLDWPSYTATYRDGATERVRLVRRVHGLGITGNPGVDRWIMLLAAALCTLLAAMGMGLLTQEEGES